jgi:hypothetical protein
MPACVLAQSRLTLFDIDLESATTSQFEAAAVQAGAKKIGQRSGATAIFDVSTLRLPNISSMRVTSFEGRVMVVQYDVEKVDELLRRTLLEKYGAPSKGRGSNFGDQYIADGSYVWPFAGRMRLVYKKEFFPSRPNTLSYVNDALMEKAEQSADAKFQGEAKRRAAESGNKL